MHKAVHLGQLPRVLHGLWSKACLEQSLSWVLECNKCAACDAGERIGKLIRNAEKAKTPVMCVVGEKEASSNQLSVRTYGEEGDRGVMAVSEVIMRIQDAGRTRMPF